MIGSVLRRILIALGIVVVLVLGWLFIELSRVLQAESDVKTRFHDIVVYYVSMDQDYVIPLLNTGILDGANRDALVGIDDAMKDLGSTPDADAQYDKLIALQKRIIPFLATTTFPETFMTDNRLTQWNKNATNLGQASNIIRSYNEALSAYNARIRSAAGKLAGLWKRWGHHQYLSIDGTLEDETVVSF